MSPNTIYLVTGGNRAKTPGIGLHLTAALLLRPHTTVITTLRSEETSQEALHALPVGENSKLVITYLDLSTPIPDPETEKGIKLGLYIPTPHPPITPPHPNNNPPNPPHKHHDRVRRPRPLILHPPLHASLLSPPELPHQHTRAHRLIPSAASVASSRGY
ncbi:putative sterigmatocystin biosynthesis ketoreductase stcE [Lachnellula cervina]|uniref:Putative sterigmatocystin biosynthesis ketoreductase stcE n=1 Tax=Lachnellula cervina TaxID=1316786 RepID=A0A7D8UQF2_9HELO|nr:putative sterigmatocystin biosynthesis ketoreductase stcE [Lachnellula cervina]